MTDKWAAMKSGDNDDWKYQTVPRCPHCGKHYEIFADGGDYWDYLNSGKHTIDCPHCGLEYSFYTETEHRFSSFDEPQP